MKVIRLALAGAVLLSSAVSAHAQSVSLEFDDGQVTLSARNAPLRTILAEWARVGGSKIVNAERVTGEPLTLELTDVSEREALSVLLRDVSGYIVAPRQTASNTTSSFDRILILPTSAPVSAALPRPQTSGPPPVVFIPGDPDEDPAGDIPPDGFPRTVPNGATDVDDVNRQLREAAERAESASEAEDAADTQEPDSSGPGRSRQGDNPFGNIQGSSQPGVITPPPDDDRNDNDDDPDR